MKINLIGAGAGSGLSAHLQPILQMRGHEVHINCINPEMFDVQVFCGLWHLDWKTHTRQDFYSTSTVALAVGSDVYRDYKDLSDSHRDINYYLRKCDVVLIANESMREILNARARDLNIKFWHAPIDEFMLGTWKAWNIFPIEKMNRDVLFYCAAPDHQDLNKILEYIENHPERKCTLLGRGYQDFIMMEYENMLSVRFCVYNCMPWYFLTHKEYRSYFTREVDLVGKMACEALYMGCKAYANDQEIIEIPYYMRTKYAMDRLEGILHDVVDK